MVQPGSPAAVRRPLPGRFQNRTGLPEAQSPGCASPLSKKPGAVPRLRLFPFGAGSSASRRCPRLVTRRREATAPSIPLIPARSPRAILLPITPHGRPAGEQWWGGPGGGFASSTGSKSALRQDERSLEPDSSKNRCPEAKTVSFFKLTRGGCRLGVRSSVTTAFRRRLGALAPRPCLWNISAVHFPESARVLPKTRRPWPQA